jgi:hypothetical protein
MKNTFEKAIKYAALTTFLVVLLFILFAGKCSGQSYTHGDIAGKHYMMSVEAGQVRMALMTPETSSDPHGYRCGDSKAIQCAYEGTPSMVFDMISEEYTLAGLSFPCFCDAIGAGQTPAALQYYDRCQDIKRFIDSLR